MKRVKAAIILLIVVFSCAFAANDINIQWKYKLNKFVEENYTLSFIDYAGNIVSNLAVDTQKGISSPQVRLKVTTNKVRSFSINITFSPMRSLQGSANYDASFCGHYQARVSDLFQDSIQDPDHKDAYVISDESVMLTIPGETTNNANNTITFYYPLSFNFQDYIEDYPVGSYTSTITVEISGS